MNRRMQFLTGEMYHLYNRGNRKAEVFHDREDYLYFLRQLREYLRYLARYFHRNPVQANLCRAPEDWEFSNYRDVIGLRHGTLCDFSPVLARFANDANLYREFVLDALADEWEPRLMKKIREARSSRISASPSPSSKR